MDRKYTVEYTVESWRRSGLFAQMVDSVRRDVDRFARVVVATADGAVDGETWLAAHDRECSAVGPVVGDCVLDGLFRATSTVMRAMVLDSLDVEYDGVTLRVLLEHDRFRQQERSLATSPWLSTTPAQRAAVSAHWSAQLRAMVQASEERNHNRVRVDLEVDPWE